MIPTDRIEKSMVLRAPRSRVWRALTDSAEFGTWFRAKLEGGFEVGATGCGRVTYEGYEHLTMEMRIEAIEPESRFAFRWHPGAGVPEDPATAPTTLVEFRLEDIAGGTRLTVIESGFDALPPELRESAFRDNSSGWTIQMENITTHVGG